MEKKSRFGLKIRKHPRLLTLNVTNSPFFVKLGDLLVVETDRGEELGVAVKMPYGCERHGLHEEFKIHNIIRKATPHDEQLLKTLPSLEKEYFIKINRLVNKQEPLLKIITCELLFNQRKLILYYRLLEEPDPKKDKKEKHYLKKPNLKELNRELFNLLKIPIDLKEMGNRASAKVIDGTGHCGCKLCCTAWLPKPKHVAIKMVKDQSLSMNIPKLSGVCGKLLCCIAYEHTQYDHGKLMDTAISHKHKEEDDLLEYAKMFKDQKNNN